MKRFGRFAMVTLGLVGLGTLGLLAPQKNAKGAGAAPVLVTNTTESPLPVSGSVGINNTVPVSGTINANVTFPSSLGVTTVAAGPLTNVGRLPSKQVTLDAVSTSFCPSGWRQVHPDGTTNCFTMADHSGEALDITDMEWFASFNVAVSGNMCQSLLSAPQSGVVFIVSASASSSDGYAAKSEHLTTGAVFTFDPVVSFHGNCAASVVTLRGYLLPNQ